MVLLQLNLNLKLKVSRKDELIMLHEFIDRVGLGFIIKIGGVKQFTT